MSKRLTSERSVALMMKNSFPWLEGDVDEFRLMLAAYENESERNRRDGEALRLYFGLNGEDSLTLKEIAQKWGTSAAPPSTSINRVVRILRGKMMTKERNDDIASEVQTYVDLDPRIVQYSIPNSVIEARVGRDFSSDVLPKKVVRAVGHLVSLMLEVRSYGGTVAWI